MSGIYWLASYPKSGNTWLRVFLANYWRNAEQPADINHLDSDPIASARGLFDYFAGMESSDLSVDEIDVYRPKLYRLLAANAAQPRFLKIHDALTQNRHGEPIVPADATLGVIYIIRNPLDVAVSYAHFSAIPVSVSVENLCKNEHKIGSVNERFGIQLRQVLGNWSEHIKSWVDASNLPVMVLRYEDMHAEPRQAFTRVLNFINAEVDEDKLLKAIEFSTFRRLQNMEKEHGFQEKSFLTSNFFRKGKTGSWRDEMSPELVEKLLTTHKLMMQRFGYLDENDQPVF